MASFELSAFGTPPDISLVAALETPNHSCIQLGFWVTDPYQEVCWGKSPHTVLAREDFLWTKTCFELFIGIQGQDAYREINLSPTLAWQAYRFEEYRYPEHSPPPVADDIQLLELQRTKFGLTAILELKPFLDQQQLKIHDLYFGLAAIISTTQQQHCFALQHSGTQPDFHNKRDWLYHP
jgi:hypothetical protein